MSGSCFLPGCHSGYRGSSTHLFKFPRRGDEALKQQWVQLIPKREDCEWNFERSRLCYLHFEEKYIQKENVVVFEGNVIARAARTNWTLTRDAVPTLFSNETIPNYFNKSVVKRKAPAERSPKPHEMKKVSKRAPDPNSNKFTFQDLFQAKHEIELPNENWLIRPSSDVKVLTIVELKPLLTVNSNAVEIESSLKIKENLEIEVMLRGQNRTDKFQQSIRQVQDVNKIIVGLDTKKCVGVSSFTDILKCKSGIKMSNTWFSNSCSGIIDRMCASCAKLKKTLTVIRSRKKTVMGRGSNKHQIEESKSSVVRRLRCKTKQLRQNQSKLASAQATLRLVRQRLRLSREVTLISAIKSTPGIPENMKLSMITALRLAKAKSRTGKRYEADWLLHCVLIRIKSPKAYKFLRDNNLLPLPHPTSLHKLISGIPCEFGFTEFVFDQLCQEFKTKTERDRQVVLVFDEIKVKESLQFDKFNMEFHGLIDYGDYTDEYFDKKPNAERLADHALVFMVRSLSERWAQPIGTFASRGAAPGFVLTKLLLSCIIKLENSGVRVTAITCDGAQSNKSVWTAFGITGKAGNVVNKIINPADGTRCIYFMSDVPHVMKCIRNNLMKKKLVIFNGSEINWKFYEAVYTEDSKRSIRAAPKLTTAHLNPALFQKMIVRLATQLFSNSVAVAMKFYRDTGVDSLQGSEQTEEFTNKLNSIFDILNARYSKVGIRKGDTGYNELLEFSKMIGAVHTEVFTTALPGNLYNNTFASVTTMESLRVTVCSAIELIDHLTTLGFRYVLTGKLNQDCLEKFFGIIRSINGDDSHPTVPSFIHLYRLLCLQVPTSKTLRGNIQTDDSSPGILFSYNETLKHLSQKRKLKSKEKKQGLKDAILEKMVEAHSELKLEQIVNLDHDYTKNNNQEPSLLFQLCGYIAYKRKLLSKCTGCQESLCCSSLDCDSAPESYFTKLKSLGGLKYPSRSLYGLIDQYIEPVIENHLKYGPLIGNMVNELISHIQPISVQDIGCTNPEHKTNLVLEIITYYISVRMFFYIRHFNRDKLPGSTICRKKMKEGKLQ